MDFGFAADAENRTDASFRGTVQTITFGRAQYQWQPLKKAADPDGPPVRSQVQANAGTSYELPAASIVVLRGKLQQAK